MASGNRPPAPNLAYPEKCVQQYATPWWEQDNDPDLRRGRLVWAFIPHMGVEPWTLELVGRTDPTVHSAARYRLDRLSIYKPPKKPDLPVAAWPAFEGEVLTVFPAKKRPALVLSLGGELVPDDQRKGSARWTTAQTILVAPYYGSSASADRGGWPVPLIERIRECEYPQFIWDQLPLTSSTRESVLMLNRIQPIGDHRNSIQITAFRMGADALDILDEWIGWLLTGTMEADGLLPEIQRVLKEP